MSIPINIKPHKATKEHCTQYAWIVWSIFSLAAITLKKVVPTKTTANSLARKNKASSNNPINPETHSRLERLHGKNNAITRELMATSFTASAR